jgi:hypothetical protein
MEVFVCQYLLIIRTLKACSGCLQFCCHLQCHKDFRYVTVKLSYYTMQAARGEEV